MEKYKVPSKPAKSTSKIREEKTERKAVKKNAADALMDHEWNKHPGGG